jgi:ADP-ribose pyrophosphatase YjhB (NUDIX family)
MSARVTGLFMTELPMFDARGGSLVSLVRLDGVSVEDADESSPFACALVVVEWGQRVLFGFNISRQQWELPGGTVEEGESARDAALRELAEETSIQADRVSLVARAEFMFDGEATRYLAAVFAVVLGSDPELVESDELHNFIWWDPMGELFNELSPLDAEVVRRCFAHA